MNKYSKTQNDERSIEQFIINLTTMAVIFKDNPPQKLLKLITIPDNLTEDIMLYFRFIQNAVNFLFQIKPGTDIDSLFKTLLNEEKNKVDENTLRKELDLYKKYKEIINTHFKKIITKRSSLKPQIVIKDVIIKDMLMQCQVICNSSAVEKFKIDSLSKLHKLLFDNKDKLELEDLRTMMSFLIQRLIPNKNNNYEKNPDIRIKLAVLISQINVQFFSSNQAIWLRLKRYCNLEEKLAIVHEIKQDPFT